MTQQVINTGASVNDGTGESIRSAFTKVNANFAELYAGGAYGGAINVVRDYGADPSGVQTSHSQINDAMEEAAESTFGGAVYIPNGMYSIKQTLLKPSKVRLFGDGFGTIIRSDFDGSTTIPNVTGLGIGATLEYAPMLCNTTPIQWGGIHGIQFWGNNKNCYGIWLGAAYWMSLRDVFILETNKRPYTAINTAQFQHSMLACYGCGDGILGWKNINHEFSTVGVERCDGANAFHWRNPDDAFGGCKISNLWFEGDNTKCPTNAFIYASGRGLSVDVSYAANLHSTRTPDHYKSVPSGDSITVDGIVMVAQAAINGEYRQLHRTGVAHVELTSGARGNAISGYISVASVVNTSGNTLNNDLGVPVVASVGASNANSVASLA